MTLESPAYLAVTALTLVLFIAALVLVNMDAKELYYGAESWLSHAGK